MTWDARREWSRALRVAGTTALCAITVQRVMQIYWQRRLIQAVVRKRSAYDARSRASAQLPSSDGYAVRGTATETIAAGQAVRMDLNTGTVSLLRAGEGL